MRGEEDSLWDSLAMQVLGGQSCSEPTASNSKVWNYDF